MRHDVGRYVSPRSLRETLPERPCSSKAPTPSPEEGSLPALFEATLLKAGPLQNSQPSSPQKISYLDLPAELRTCIYREAIKLPNMRTRWYDIPIRNLQPTAPALRDISGFILSCRQVYKEVERQVVRAVYAYLHFPLQAGWLRITKSWPLGLPWPDYFFETVHIVFAIEIPADAYYPYLDLERADWLASELAISLPSGSCAWRINWKLPTEFENNELMENSRMFELYESWGKILRADTNIGRPMSLLRRMQLFLREAGA